MFDPALFGFAKEWYTFCLPKGAGEFRKNQREDMVTEHRAFYTLVGGFCLSFWQQKV